jgi:ribosome-binding protein aMBF1 (putative translation factor)
MNKPISPTGESVEESIVRHMQNPQYWAAHLRMRVSEEIASTVILGRTRARWSQARLAREIGTTPSVISRLESGQHQVSVETLRRIANAMGVSFIIDPDPAGPPRFEGK